MEITLIMQLLIIVIVNSISNTLGTLKTIFVSKRFMKPLFVITFVDAIIFATVMKQVINDDNGISFIIAFAIGKVIGTFIADVIESKLALGLLETDFFVSDKQKMKTIADALRDNGYSVNTYISYGYQGAKRYKIEVAILRKELNCVKEILKNHGFENPTFMAKDINGAYGKLSIKKTA